MTTIFQALGPSTFGGAFTGEATTLSFGVGATAAGGSPSVLPAGLLTQQVAMQYAQAVNRFYEVGSQSVYYVGGRTQGTASLSRVIGPSPLLQAFYSNFGNVCQAAGNQMTFAPGTTCTNSSQLVSYTAYYCVITQLGINVAAQDMVITEQSSMLFSSLDYQGP